MGALQLYAKLGVVLNGDLLLQQAGVVIDDHVGRACRVTVESVLPESGYEVDARNRLDEVVKLAVVVIGPRFERGSTILEIEGPIVAVKTSQPRGEGHVVTTFTVEHRPAER